MSNVEAVSPEQNIIPKPNRITPKKGSFEINWDTAILVHGEEEREIANYVISILTPSTGFQFPISTNLNQTSNYLELALDENIKGTEAYTLKVSEKSITIKALNTKGLFYAVQTLRQIIPPEIEKKHPVNDISWSVPAVDIIDEPKFGYRGMHLDVSRHFFSKEFIKKYIDLIALHKMNTFHWHLTDDQGWRIEIKKYPLLTEIGSKRKQTVVGFTLDRTPIYDNTPHQGYYTQDDIKEIVAYAKDRHIEVIPEIDVPGHATAMIAAYPELACTPEKIDVEENFGIFQQTLCPTESTFEFLDGVLGEIASLFPSAYLHIGGDEAQKTPWKKCSSCSTLMEELDVQNYEQLQAYFVRRVESIVQHYGKTIIGWDEVLDGEDIAPSTVIMSWRGEQGEIRAANAGHNVIMAEVGFLYFNMYQSVSQDEPMAPRAILPLRDVYHYSVIPESIPKHQHKYILGAQGSLWTEYVKTPAHAEYMVFPRMCALAEVLWTNDSQRDWKNFVARMDSHFDRLDLLEVRASKSLYNVVGRISNRSNNTVNVELKTEGLNHRILYTLDGTKPNLNSMVYNSQPISIQSSCTVRAVSQNISTGEVYGEYKQSIEIHLGFGKPVSLGNAPFEKEHILTNGIVKHDSIYHPGGWYEFYGDNILVVVDLEKSEIIERVELGVNAGKHIHLYPPQKVTVLVSDDNTNWNTVAELEEHEIDRQGNLLSTSFNPISARYVKLLAKNDRLVMSTERGRLEPVLVRIDEIRVY